LDTEFLHDFRVAVRRTRTLLTQIKRVFPEEAAARFVTEFSWLAKATGPTRDLDVLLLALRETPDELSADEVAAFRADVVQEQQREHGLLVQQLAEARYRALTSGWRTFLKRAKPRGPEPENAGKPLAEVVSRRAWRLYRRIAARAEAVHGATPPEVLHQTRIDAKKLRYLIDATRSLYPVEALDRVLRALKKLQGVLGDFNDATVQERRLLEYGRAVAERDPEGSSTHRAIERLAKARRRRGERLRWRISRELTRFCDADMRSEVQSAFSTDVTPEDAR
jgi:CHAD domain-containing protein